MTNKYLYFVANWKMYGDLKALNSLDKVIKFSKSVEQKKIKLIYCPPSTLINSLFNKLKKTKIEVGAQNSHESDKYGAFTGQINSKMLKMSDKGLRDALHRLAAIGIIKIDTNPIIINIGSVVYSKKYV